MLFDRPSNENKSPKKPDEKANSEENKTSKEFSEEPIAETPLAPVELTIEDKENEFSYLKKFSSKIDWVKWNREELQVRKCRISFYFSLTFIFSTIGWRIFGQTLSKRRNFRSSPAMSKSFEK